MRGVQYAKIGVGPQVADDAHLWAGGTGEYRDRARKKTKPANETSQLLASTQARRTDHGRACAWELALFVRQHTLAVDILAARLGARL